MKVIHVARKPPNGSAAKTAMNWGSGGLHISASRIGITVETWPATRSYAPGQIQPGGKGSTQATGAVPAGRWPANLILEHLPECHCEGVCKVKSQNPKFASEGKGGTQHIYSARPARPVGVGIGYGENGQETVANWVCVEGCPVLELNALSGDRPSTLTGRADPAQPHEHPADVEIHPDRLARTRCNWGTLHAFGNVYADSGGAARFFKQVSWETK
jgi:hypothetical protein